MLLENTQIQFYKIRTFHLYSLVASSYNATFRTSQPKKMVGPYFNETCSAQSITASAIFEAIAAYKCVHRSQGHISHFSHYEPKL